MESEWATLEKTIFSLLSQPSGESTGLSSSSLCSCVFLSGLFFQKRCYQFTRAFPQLNRDSVLGSGGSSAVSRATFHGPLHFSVLVAHCLGPLFSIMSCLLTLLIMAAKMLKQQKRTQAEMKRPWIMLACSSNESLSPLSLIWASIGF